MPRSAVRRILIKTPEQIEGIRASCELTVKGLDMVAERIGPGVTTEMIDQWVYDFVTAHGGQPATLGYHGYAKSCCTSVNEVVTHGIPDDTVLCEGDIVNVDIATIVNGYYGDASRMYCIGSVSDEARKLVEVTRECLHLGIEQVKPGNTVGHIGWACQRHAESHGFGVVRDYCGHGVGIEFQEPPEIVHFGRKGQGAVLRENMVITIEPMINAGSHELTPLDDGWAVVTADGALSAQWEHTVLVTRQGHEILTGHGH